MACAQAAKRLVRKQRKIISDQEDWDREQEARQSAQEARKDNECFHYRPEQHITTKKQKYYRLTSLRKTSVFKKIRFGERIVSQSS